MKVQVAGSVLDMVYLQKIREDASAAYSASAAGYAQRVGDKVYTQLLGAVPMQPEKAELALQIMRDEVPALTKSVNEDYLTKTKEQLLKQFDTNLKDNEFWIRALTTYESQGIDLVTDYKKVVNSITPKVVSDFVKTAILSSGNHIEVIMLPE